MYPGVQEQFPETGWQVAPGWADIRGIKLQYGRGMRCQTNLTMFAETLEQAILAPVSSWTASF